LGEFEGFGARDEGGCGEDFGEVRGGAVKGGAGGEVAGGDDAD